MILRLFVDGKEAFGLENIKVGKLEEFYFHFFYKLEDDKTILVSDVIAGKTGYRLVKTRWYHRVFDAIGFNNGGIIRDRKKIDESLKIGDAWRQNAKKGD